MRSALLSTPGAVAGVLAMVEHEMKRRAPALTSRYTTEKRARQGAKRALCTGNWGEWESFNLAPGQIGAAGWLNDITRVVRNDWCTVLIRPLKTEMGNVLHAAISTVTGQDLKWTWKQRIKNEVFGEGAYAVEVFPKESDLVDGANMYHLWILPTRLPFGLAGEEDENQTPPQQQGHASDQAGENARPGEAHGERPGDSIRQADDMFPIEPCKFCRGTGFQIYGECEDCEGTGKQIAGEHGT